MEKTGMAVPVIPISYGSTAAIETGNWSRLKPQNLVMVAPCRESCPMGTDIPLFIHFIEQRRYAEALSTVLRENPFPGVCGRVCFHPCETVCNRAQYDEAVSIQMLERFISSTEPGRIPIAAVAQEAPQRVAVIGSGPAGLSCAYFLALLGHRPTVFEARCEPGGVMRWGIPRFRLPKTVLKREIARVFTLPIALLTNRRAGKDFGFEELNRFDAVFLSPGAGVSSLLSIPGEDLEGVWNGGEFLEKVNARKKVLLGKETLVIGGGNTAMDAARAALRMGSRVSVVYRRTREAMPAIPDEVREAEEEGVAFRFLLQPLKIQRSRSKRLKVTFQRMKPGRRDKGGRTGVVPVKGEYVTMESDAVVGAVGEIVDVSWLPRRLVNKGLIETGCDFRIFAGGDAVAQPRTIADAMASGKRAAISIDLRFRGVYDRDAISGFMTGGKGAISMDAYLRHIEGERQFEPKAVVSNEQINTLYFQKSKRAHTGKLQPEKRRKTFREVKTAPDETTALVSASRCYSCGRCNACYNCFYFCPEGAISIDRDRRIRTVDLMHCKGCGTCAKACPRNAVEMKDLP